MGLEEHGAELARCNRCGFCQAACPVFKSTGREAGVARGRLALLRGLLEGRTPWSGELKEPLFNCLLCGACTAHCFPAVKTADLVVAARAEYQEKVGRPKLQRLLFKHLLPHPRRLRLAGRALALGKRTRLSKLARMLGLLRAFGRSFSRAEGIVERVPAPAFRARVPPGKRAGQNAAGPKLAFFVGCGMDLMAPAAAAATLARLSAGASEVTVLDNCCCGLPPHGYGDRETALALAAKNLELIGRDRYDEIVTDCSSCASFLKAYPGLFAADDPRRDAAEKLAARTRDVLQLAPPAVGGKAGAEKPLVVTWHDPCHAARGQELRQEPRRLLRSLPGVEYRELPEADWCCGGAGSYALGHYELSLRVLERKLDNLEKTGADVLVTSCPACLIQLAHGIRRRGLATRVAHLSELIRDLFPEVD